jgi:prepilin-type N-terminal cleavage/methylation domain-containing protein
VRPRRRADAGFSLIETLIAVAISGTLVVGIVSGYSTAILGSSRHGKVTDTDVLSRSVAESVEGQAYLPCPATTYSDTASDITYPAGWSASAVAIDVLWWHAATDTFTASCPDEGLQRVTVNVVSPDGDAVRSLQVFKRAAI